MRYFLECAWLLDRHLMLLAGASSWVVLDSTANLCFPVMALVHLTLDGHFIQYEEIR